jgi:NAD(P)-dependent dehydrogenase (short-subunit alcohol dehydrogenase family)
VNPQTGPFFVAGAEPGDTLVLHFAAMEPARDWGASAAIPFFGGLTGTDRVFTLQDPLPDTTCATMKTALLGYLKGLAHQHAGRVRANVVSPGNIYFAGGFWQQAEADMPDLYGSQLGHNPTGRMATPEEIARTVVFLSSPVSSFTTGAHLLVDGALSRGIQL